LSHLNGMYAFAFFDAQTQELILARDPLGIKPLYYFTDERGIFFGSEIRALQVARRTPPALREDLIARYLMNGWIPDPDTLFEGIFKVSPGHFLRVRANGEVSETKFWDFHAQPAKGL